MLCDKIQGSRRSQIFQDLIGVRYARDFNADSIRTFLINICFSRILIDTLLQLVDGIVHIRYRRSCLIRFVCDRYTAGKIKAGADILHRPSAVLTPPDECRKAGHYREDDSENKHNDASLFLHVTLPL